MPARHPLGLPESLSAIDRTLIMGILNVTPDSFSDGGRYANVDDAVAHGLALVADGADIVDVGGESTRPGSVSVEPTEEARRVLPVVAALSAEGVHVSIDTMHSVVAAAAVEAGAAVVNDVSGGLVDPRMLDVVRSSRVPYVVMHWRGASSRNHDTLTHRDVVSEVVADLGDRLRAVQAAGIDPGRVVVDPGLGFAKDSADNWSLLRHLDDLRALGAPLLIGASRKRFLGQLLEDSHGMRAMEERDDATAALSALVALQEVWGVRVHDSRASRDAVMVAREMRSQR